MVYKRLAELAKEHAVTLEPDLYTHSVGEESSAAVKTVTAASTAQASDGKSQTKSTIALQISGSATTTTTTTVTSLSGIVRTRTGPSTRHIQAYTLWHVEKLSMDDLRSELRSKENPLSVNTVMYVLNVQLPTTGPSS